MANSGQRWSVRPSCAYELDMPRFCTAWRSGLSSYRLWFSCQSRQCAVCYSPLRLSQTPPQRRTKSGSLCPFARCKGLVHLHAASGRMTAGHSVHESIIVTQRADWEDRATRDGNHRRHTEAWADAATKYGNGEDRGITTSQRQGLRGQMSNRKDGEAMNEVLGGGEVRTGVSSKGKSTKKSRDSVRHQK